MLTPRAICSQSYGYQQCPLSTAFYVALLPVSLLFHVLCIYCSRKYRMQTMYNSTTRPATNRSSRKKNKNKIMRTNASAQQVRRVNATISHPFSLSLSLSRAGWKDFPHVVRTAGKTHLTDCTSSRHSLSISLSLSFSIYLSFHQKNPCEHLKAAVVLNAERCNLTAI